jgi:hypothetical protein
MHDFQDSLGEGKTIIPPNGVSACSVSLNTTFCPPHILVLSLPSDQSTMPWSSTSEFRLNSFVNTLLDNPMTHSPFDEI